MEIETLAKKQVEKQENGINFQAKSLTLTLKYNKMGTS